MPGPVGTVSITVRVYEQPLFSRGAGGVNKRAGEIAMAVLSLLHGWYSGFSMLSSEQNAIEPSEDMTDSVVAYDVNLTACYVGDRFQGKCATPSFSQGQNGIGITCSTSGARIFISTDGSYPAEPYVAGTEYSGDVPAKLRVRAVADGLRPSDINRTF
jgi:hypothetical protein